MTYSVIMLPMGTTQYPFAVVDSRTDEIHSQHSSKEEAEKAIDWAADEDRRIDVWEAAWRALGYRRPSRSLSGNHHTYNVARAILAERERCANIADSNHWRGDIGAAIRKSPAAGSGGKL